MASLAIAARPKILSVDVFDTCIVRDLLGDEPIELAIDRRVSDRQANSTNGSSASDRSPTAAAELEELLCQPVPGVAEALARIRAAGTSIVFLSDTERSSATLRTILGQADIFVDGDELRASCEEGATKSSGELFTKVWPDRRARSELWHVGNNLWSDVTMAQQSGITAFSVAHGRASRYESVMARRAETAGPAIAAAARLARLNIDSPSSGANGSSVLERVGAQVPGQAFTAFLLWVAHVSQEEELGHLSFLSRDGELFLKMAEAMPSDHWSGRTLGYLHCSRWSWLLAGAADYGIEAWLAAGTKEESAFIHANRDKVPLRSLLGRIGLSIDDIDPSQALAGRNPDLPLPADAIQDWELVLDDPFTAELVLQRSLERRSLLVDYLHTLSLPNAPIGLVDVGWRGRLAWSMTPIIRDVTGCEPIHLHLGGDMILSDVDSVIDIRRFAFDGRESSAPIENPVSCVETMTASGRPRIVRYERTNNGTVVPKLARGVAAIQNEDRAHLWAGALRTAALMPSRAWLDQLGCSSASLAAEARDVLALWWTEPDRQEAEALQGLFFEADDDGQAIWPVLSPYRLAELAPGRRRRRQWVQGSEVLSMRPIGRLVRASRQVRQFLTAIIA